MSGSRSNRFAPVKVGLAALAALSLLTACGGGASGDSGGGKSSDGVAFKFAMGSSGAQGAFFQEAMERANNDYGYKGEWVELTGSEVAVSGIASNKFQFGAGVAATVMAAQQEEHAPLTFIADYLHMLWTLTAKNDIKSCKDLNGVRFGLHSPGGVSTAIFKSWFAKNCDASVKPQILYVEGSPNRYQGLLANQLDATMLEIDDILDLPRDRFHVMANFSKDLPNIEANTMYSNDTFLKEHPDVTVNLLKECSKLAAELNKDPSVLADAIKKYKPELADRADEISKAYVDGGIFAEDGSMSEQDLTDTIKLYEDAGAIKPGLTFDQIADRQYLEKALANN